ncbi:MAG TPA: hypothetical protein VF646_04580, partial [Cytophagales bacterium]
VRVRITTLAVPNSASAYFSCGNSGGWLLNEQDNQATELTLTGTGAKSETSVNVQLGNEPVRRRIEVFENNATVPTRTREITFVGDNTPSGSEVIEYPRFVGNNYNILSFQEDVTIGLGNLSLIALIPQRGKCRVRVTLNAKIEVASGNGNWLEKSHQVVDDKDIYEYETVGFFVKAHNDLRLIKDARTTPASMIPAKVKFELFENESSQPIRAKELDWMY